MTSRKLKYIDESLKTLESLYPGEKLDTGEKIRAVTEGILALRKQQPLPIYLGGKCICGGYPAAHSGQNYCEHCGQRLEWRGTQNGLRSES